MCHSAKLSALFFWLNCCKNSKLHFSPKHLQIWPQNVLCDWHHVMTYSNADDIIGFWLWFLTYVVLCFGSWSFYETHFCLSFCWLLKNITPNVIHVWFHLFRLFYSKTSTHRSHLVFCSQACKLFLFPANIMIHLISKDTCLVSSVHWRFFQKGFCPWMHLQTLHCYFSQGVYFFWYVCTHFCTREH